MASFNKITDLAGMRDYVKRSLGAPINCIEMDNSQIDQVIADAIDMFTRYMYGEGLFEDYFGFTISAGTSAYNLSAYFDDTIEDTINLDMYQGFRYIDSAFGNIDAFGGKYPSTSTFNDYYNRGMSEGMLIAGTDISLMYGEEWRNQFMTSYRVDFRQGSREMIVVPTPSTDGVGLLTVFRKEKAEFLFNHIIVKKLSTAFAMKLWGGLNLGKYNVTLPGGGTINFDNIYQMGVREEEYWLDRLMSEGEPVDPFMA